MPQVNEFSWILLIIFFQFTLLFWIILVNFSSSFYFCSDSKNFSKLIFHSF